MVYHYEAVYWHKTWSQFFCSEEEKKKELLKDHICKKKKKGVKFKFKKEKELVWSHLQ